MNVRMSFTTKTTIVLMAMVFTVIAVIQGFLIYSSDKRLEEQNEVAQLQNQRRLQVLERLLHERTILWVELLTQQQKGNTNQTTEDTLKDALSAANNYLALSIELEHIGLFIDDTDLFGHATTSEITDLVSETRSSLKSKSAIVCESVCLQYFAVPVMSVNENVPVVVIATSTRELLSLFYRSTAAYRVALVNVDETPNIPLTFSFSSRLATENKITLTRKLTTLPNETTIGQLVEKGQQVSVDNQHYLISLIPLQYRVSDAPYLLLVRDITDTINSNSQYKGVVLVSGIALFCIFTVLLNGFLRQYRIRLLAISRRLPLLSAHQFDDFHALAAKKHKHGLFSLPDELDVVEHSTNELARELEEIDSKMAMTTARLENMAMFDVLTGLPNRNMLTFYIENQLSDALDENDVIGLLFTDLDDFKKVNDSYGHDMGDSLLKAAALRIARTISDVDVAARFGGDEFVVLVNSVNTREEIETVAKKLVEAFSYPLDVGDMKFYLSISIGVAFSCKTRTTHVELLRHADIAMYEAKANKGDGFRIYDSTMNQRVMEKVELEAEARIALRENHFRLAFQPQVDLVTNQLVGFEALLRWHHPEKGMISPASFIPALENTGFMLELDYWVVAKATRYIREFNANGYTNLKMAINLSAGQFLDSGLPDVLQQHINQHEINSSQICLELTETVLVTDIDRATLVMQTVRDMGCQIAIDDFGTGYSSLSYLKSLPADYIKIDRSFVSSMMDCESDRNIVQSTISMVQKLGLQVVAEGIETNEQLVLLKDFHCHYGQGYFICRPILESDIWKTLADYVHNGEWQFDSETTDC